MTQQVPMLATEERAELVARFIATHSAEVVLHALALRLSKQCRERVQAHLPEAAWRECDEQFYRVLREGFAEFQAERAVAAGATGNAKT